MSIASARLCLNAAQGLIGARICGVCRESERNLFGIFKRTSERVHANRLSSNKTIFPQVSPFGACNLSNSRLGLNSPLSKRTFSVRAEESKGANSSTMAAPKEISSTKHFGGFNKRYEHESSTVGTPMKFTVYFPPAAEKQKVPVIYYLSGLSCTDENVIQKSGVQRDAAEKGVAIVACDTSPRGLNVEGESDSWDFGASAGFYLNATEEKWKGYRMYDYVVKELPELLKSHFPQLDTGNASIFGHSMGGHGALTIFFKNRDKYKTVSAFAPICHPIKAPWGLKAFPGYLGSDQSKWQEYDATVLAEKYSGDKDFHILIDQGTEDKFLHDKQLLPEEFAEVCKNRGINVKLRMQEGYDHSYYFIATFMPDHITHHVKALTSS